MSLDPGIEFIGVAVDSSPEKLLGLSIDHVRSAPGADAVLRALQDRLALISQHPEALSEKADRLRESLHAAARQLLDRSAHAVIPAAEIQRTRRIIEQFGGVTEDALDAIRMISAASGIPAGELLAAALELNSAVVTATEVDEVAVPQTRNDADAVAADDVPNRVVEAPVRWMVWIGGGLIASIAVITMVLALTLKPAPDAIGISSNRGTKSAEQARGPVAEDESKNADSATEKPTKVESDIRVWSDLIRELQACESISDTDPSAAAAAFVSTFNQMASSWPEASRDELLAAGNSVIDFLYSVDNSDRIGEIASAISPSRSLSDGRFPDPRSIHALCFSTAVAVRVLREPDLNSGLRSSLRDACEAVFAGDLTPREQTLDAGIRAALNAVPALLLRKMDSNPAPDSMVESWKSWLETLAAFEGQDSAAFDRTATLTLENAMLSLPEADRDSRTREVLKLFGETLTWRKDTVARVALLRWFDNPAVTSADLQALTSAIATTSAAEGVDQTMVLSSNADSAARTALRERYAQAWGASKADQGRSGELAKWSALAEQALEDPMPESHVLGLLKSVRFARLCSLAEVLREGVAVRVPDDIDADDEHIIAQINRSSDESKLIVIETGGDREWALRYLTESKSGSVSARISMLGSYAETSNALNADLIVQEAIRGAPEEIRQQARRIIRDRASDPVFVNALLRMQPKIIPGAENLQLIEAVTGYALPSFKSPSWKFECRRALVSKLVQLLARESPIGVIDSIAASLGGAYGAFRVEPAVEDALESTMSGGVSMDRSESDPMAAVIAVRTRLHAQAERLVPSGREPASLVAIESARIRRSQLAAGVIQRFNAEQLACVDLLSYCIVAEDPTKAAEVRDIVRKFDEIRRASTHVLESVRFAERTRLELWLLRIGRVPSPEVKSESSP